jgi:hypothetical protein
MALQAAKDLAHVFHGTPDTAAAQRGHHPFEGWG